MTHPVNHSDLIPGIKPEDIRPGAILLVPDGMGVADFQDAIPLAIALDRYRRRAMAKASSRSRRRAPTPKIKVK